MKLRIYRNSLRFRLSPADVERLDSTGTVGETTSFGPEQEFSYSLRAGAKTNLMHAVLSSRGICVEIPAELVREWSRSGTVGLRHSQALSDGKTLDILIEKDFECLEGNSDEQNEALYPNPNQSCAPDLV